MEGSKRRALSLLKFGMGSDLNIEGLLHRIVVALVDEPNEVDVTSGTTQAGTVFHVTVAPSDVGKIIGKNGRIAGIDQSVELPAMGVATKTQYVLNIVMKD
jgi:predicted RNA-binding protein YlqC (UPF0109 family)